jgi:hypothetical protein
MPAKTAPPCVLDKDTQFALLEILDALGEETDVIEIDGEEHTVADIRAKIASCSNEAVTPTISSKGGKKRGPKEPSAYNKFIGHCRKAPENGGLGLDFSQCVKEWNKTKNQ